MAEQITRQIHKIDASSDTLGRLSTRIATLLRGKNKATFSPHIDGGDIVEVSNIANLKVTGKKMEQKKYYRHSQYMGGLKTETMKEIYAKDPAKILHMAVYNMLPKNRLRDQMIKRLHIK